MNSNLSKLGIAAAVLCLTVASAPANAANTVNFQVVADAAETVGRVVDTDCMDPVCLVSVAPDNECSDRSDTNGDMECKTWECIPGDSLFVGVQSDAQSWGRAECGEGYSACDGPAGCDNRDNIRVSKSLDTGSCSGNADEGRGARLTCIAGEAGSVDDLLRALNGSSMSAAECPALAPTFEASGITSYVSATFGDAANALLWNASTGCA